MCNDWVNLLILWVNLPIRCVVTQSLNKLCDSCGQEAGPYGHFWLWKGGADPLEWAAHSQGWKTGGGCTEQGFRRQEQVSFRNIHLLLWHAPFRWNFVTRANKSDSIVTSRLRKEEPDFPLFGYMLWFHGNKLSIIKCLPWMLFWRVYMFLSFWSIYAVLS